MAQNKEPQASADAILDKLDAFLRTKQLKLTSQRRQIVEKMLEMPRHFTADDLVDSFVGQRPRVSKATVYRTLSLLSEGEILEQHDFGEGHRLFELALGRSHHDHLCCTKCGKIIEFFSEEMENLQDKIAHKLGFHPTSHSQKIYGTCRECWRESKRD
ncbi:transcriptional repressor [bacterium]|nr:MAG: transcriptional repressor [bacterium]RIK64440.1 MAG: transcriptional repressor [Planctomycetota bacterium]